MFVYKEEYMPILADLVVEQTVEQRGQLLGGVLQRVDGGVRRQNLAQVSSATRRLFIFIFLSYDADHGISTNGSGRKI